MAEESPNDMMSNGGSASSERLTAIRDKRNSVKRMQRDNSTTSWTGSTTGILPGGAKTKRIERYETMLKRVAQNAYDGLSLVRNEHIAKVQGLEANPLDQQEFT